jgi:hypothetical protein
LTYFSFLKALISPTRQTRESIVLKEVQDPP